MFLRTFVITEFTVGYSAPAFDCKACACDNIAGSFIRSFIHSYYFVQAAIK